MSTLYQRYKNGTFRKKDNSRTPALKQCPQVRGTVMRARIVTPRKPNSAKRPVGKVILVNKKRVTAHIPGIGHNIRRYSKVLVRGGGSRDLPGVRYSLIRGVMDFMGLLNKKRRRSIYGAPKKDRISKRRYERVPLHEFLKNNLDNFKKNKNDYNDFKRELINLKILKRNKNLEDQNLELSKIIIKNNDILLNSNLNSSDEYAEYNKFYERINYNVGGDSDVDKRRSIRMEWRRLDLKDSINNYFNLNFFFINNKKINDNFLTFYFFFKNSLINYFFDLKFVYQLTNFNSNTNISVFVIEDYFKKLKYYLLGKDDLLAIFNQNIYYNNIFNDLYDYNFDIIYNKFFNFVKNSTKSKINRNILKESTYTMYLNSSYTELVKYLDLYLHGFSSNKNLKTVTLKNQIPNLRLFNYRLKKNVFVYKFNIIKTNTKYRFNMNIRCSINLFKFSITNLNILNINNLKNKYFFSFSNIFNNTNKIPLRFQKNFINNNDFLNIFLKKNDNFSNHLKKLQNLEEKNILYLRKRLLNILNCSSFFYSYLKTADFINRCKRVRKFRNKYKDKSFKNFNLENFQYNNEKSSLKSLYYLKKVFFKKSIYLLNFINNYFSKNFSNILYNILTNFENFNKLLYNSTLLLNINKIKSRNENFNYFKKNKNIDDNLNFQNFDLIGGKHSSDNNFYVEDEFDISGDDVNVDNIIPADLKESEFSLEQKIIIKKKEFFSKYNGSYSTIDALGSNYKNWNYFNKDNKNDENNNIFIDNFSISTLNNKGNFNMFNHNYNNILPYTENFFLYYNNLLPFYDELQNIYSLLDFIKINNFNFNNLDKFANFMNNYNLLTLKESNDNNLKKTNNIYELEKKIKNKNILFYKPIFFKFNLIDTYSCINNNLLSGKLNISKYLTYSIHKNNFNKFYHNTHKFVINKKYFINCSVKKKFKKKMSKKYNYIFFKLLLNNNFLNLSNNNCYTKINNKYYDKKIISNFSWLHFI